MLSLSQNARPPIKIASFDPSLRNWGVALAHLSYEGLEITDTAIIKTKNTKSKVLKQNTSDINSALILYEDLVPYILWADLITVEVPHGSQSSRAMVSYGVCVALIGVIQSMNANVIQVSANDVKAVVREDKSHKPTKEDVIRWVRDKHPEANLPNTLSAEHICDAIVAIHAAMETEKFKDYL